MFEIVCFILLEIFCLILGGGIFRKVKLFLEF